MPQLLRKKYIFIIVSVLLTMLSTSIFIIGEQHFKLDESEMEAFVLSEDLEKTKHDETFYRKLIDNNSDEFLIMETDVIIKFASSKWKYEMELENEDILEKNFFSIVHPKDLPFIANSFINILDSAKIDDNIGPFRLINKKNESKLYMGKAIPIFNEEHKIILIGLVLTDISNPLGGKEEESDLSEVGHEELENLISLANSN